MKIPSQKTVRLIWIAYALALLTATHWPMLTIPAGPVSRMDLVIHFLAFGLWTLLFYHSGWIAKKHCPIRRIVWTGIIAAAFSVFDELTQPMFSRVADISDLAADIAGILVMCLVIAGTRSMMPTPPNTRSQQA